MNETLRTIYGRRAVRKYINRPILPEIIDQVIDAGRMAPSAINKQPWKFYVLTNKEKIQAISAEVAQVAEKYFHLSHGADRSLTSDFIFHGAPVVIFITAPKENEWATIDVGMCAQNMMLAAASLGVATCPIGLAKFAEQTPYYSKLLIPATDHILLAVILGHADEHPEAPKRNKDNVFSRD